MQIFSWFFGGAVFGGGFFSVTPNVGGGDYSHVYLKGRKRTSTDIFLDRRRFGLDESLNATLSRWGRPRK